ncbi:hypothetical protein Fcan01_12461 [Folsomia candida]|uniref:Uncharacterized protein n=1 Tax=Folsomia candida TaxID=158441 RepID=A0A226E657_FOLCA|nr:hypothetical protein Fcan01_12461 [Folsomia candida]
MSANFLDTEMYKISEEDSQDEEVLNSLSTTEVLVPLSLQTNHGGNTNNNNNNVIPPLRVKPVPPVKPAFLRKALTTSLGVGNNSNSHAFPPPVNVTNITSTSGDTSVTSVPAIDRLIPPTSSSSSFDEARTRKPHLVTTTTTTSVTTDPDDGQLGWPSSTDTQSGDSGDDSGEVTSEDRNNLETTTRHAATAATIQQPPPRVVLPHSSHRKMKRHKRRRESSRVAQSENNTEDNESTQSDQSYCSSCDERQQNHHDGHPSDEDTGSYYDDDEDDSTDHSDSGSDDLDFDDQSDTVLEEEVASLLTEAEIQSWGRGDGNVLLCEYVSATNGPEILESANDKSGLHSKSKSKSIHPSLYSSSAPGSLEIGSGLHQPSDSSNGNKGAKGKISRLLKRGTKQKNERHLEGSSKMELSARSTTTSSVPPPTASELTTTTTEKESSKNILKPCGANKVFRFKGDWGTRVNETEHEGEIRLVDLFIRSTSKHNLGRRATMVESLLGIVPSRFSSRTASDRSNSSSSVVGIQKTDDKRIMVAGFIPDGPAARNKQIKIGKHFPHETIATYEHAFIS